MPSAVLTVSNLGWNLNLKAATTATGASGTLIVHGPVIDQSSIFIALPNNDNGTTVSGAIDLTAALFLDFQAATGTGGIATSITQQLATLEPASTIGPAGPTGASGGGSGSQSIIGSAFFTVGGGVVTASTLTGIVSAVTRTGTGAYTVTLTGNAFTDYVTQITFGDGAAVGIPLIQTHAAGSMTYNICQPSSNCGAFLDQAQQNITISH
jgi:hypothetical protein